VSHSIQALIFDMDDTLVATAPIWRDAENTLLRALGHPDFPLAERCKGMNARDVAATAHRELSGTMPLPQCQRLMRARLLENFGRLPIEAVPGAMALVQRCRATGLPMAVASGSPMQAIAHAMDSLGIRQHMRVLVASESVERGKPHPDVFIATAEKLNVPPGNCLVFEDSLVGVKAAAAAGMRCMVRPSIPGSIPADLAMRVVRDWDEVPIHELDIGIHMGSAEKI